MAIVNKDNEMIDDIKFYDYRFYNKLKTHCYNGGFLFLDYDYNTK